jgi:hypothetical protein
MAIDRAGARRRVRTITAWAAGGALALTAAAAFGAARGNHAAKTTPRSTARIPPSTQDPGAGGYGYSPAPYQGSAPEQGFTPPSASQAPPAGMSGGS